MKLAKAMERWHNSMQEYAKGRGRGVIRAAREGMATMQALCDEENLSPGERTMLLRSAAGTPVLVAGDWVMVMDVDGGTPVELIGLTLEVEGIDPEATDYVILLRRRMARNPVGSAFWTETSPEKTEKIKLPWSYVELESCARTPVARPLEGT